MSLYTGPVMDAFDNGLPGFMVLCDGELLQWRAPPKVRSLGIGHLPVAPGQTP